jgi:choline dehydrogenase
MLESAAAVGIPMVEDLNDLDEPVGMAPSPANIHDGIRWNGSFAFLDPVRDRPNLRIIGDALVDRLEFNSDRVTGVRVIHDGKAGVIEAGAVMLAAGTYNSPMILLRSGIGPADDLRALGIEPVLDLPGVGENLHDHPAVYLQYAGSDALREQMTEWATSNWLPEEQTIAKLRSKYCAEAFDLHIYPEGGPYADGRTAWSFTIPVACMTPKSRGSIRLRAADPAALPIIDHRYLSDPDWHDRAVLVDGIGIGREIARHANRYSLLGHELAPGPAIQAEADLAEWVSRNVHHYFHAAGTCKMAPESDNLAVVDARAKVRGLDGAFVADCSIMPQVPRANTNIPAVVVGLRIATWLAEG